MNDIHAVMLVSHKQHQMTVLIILNSILAGVCFEVWMNIFKFFFFLCVRSCAFICTCQQWVTMGHALCIYFWLAAGPSSLSCLRVTERTLEWACTCIYRVFSAVAGLPHIWSVKSLRMFCSTLTHMSAPHTLLSGQIHFESLHCFLWPRKNSQR